MKNMNTPLMDLRVLDLTRVLAGPLATMLLGDLGADVIKVERPGTGDETRGWGPPFDPDGESAYFLSVNRNKRSLVADLGKAEDRALLRQLILDADIVVDNFRPGTLARAGLDPEVLLRAAPRLVWCTISGFGADHDRPGYDFVVQAEQGWMAITGPADGIPVKHGVALADVIAGKDAAVAILAALVGRDRGAPTARRLEVSLAASATAALVNVAQNALVSGREPARWGNAHANLVPYQLFEAADAPLVIAVGSDAQWQAIVRALDLPALAADPALSVNAGRLAQRERVVSAIATRLATAPAARWLAALDAVGVPCGRVRRVSEVLAAIDASAVFGLPSPVGGAWHRRPPRLGEHDAEIRGRGWARASQS